MSDKNEARLARLSERVSVWRSEHGGRGCRLPKWVWEEASSMAAKMGVSTTAQALRLSPRRLAACTNACVEDGPAFVELNAGEVVLGGLRVEIEMRGGRRARVWGGDPEIIAKVTSVLLDEERA